MSRSVSIWDARTMQNTLSRNWLDSIDAQKMGGHWVHYAAPLYGILLPLGIAEACKEVWLDETNKI